MKKNIILLLFFFSSFTSKATHILGGEITWECLPTGQYRFILMIYRDCTGLSLNSMNQVISVCGGSQSIPVTKIAVNYINKDCNDPGCAGATLTSGSNGTPYIGAIEQHIYRSAPITLIGTPPPSGWSFEWYDCCRPSTMTNVNGGAYNLRAFMYPYVPPGSTTAMPADPCFNDSPEFLEAPSLVYCAGMDSEFFIGSLDKNGDSLFVDWADPLNNSSCSPPNSVNWASSFSATTPLPDTTHHPANVPAVLDHDLASVSFKSFTTGAFVTGYKIEEYRHGQLISKVFRDIPLYVKNCAGISQCNSALPTFSEVSFTSSNPADSIALVSSTPSGSKEVYRRLQPAKAGDSVSFVFKATDLDSTSSCNLELITIDGYGTYLPQNMAVNCNGAPCAQITSLNPQGGFTDSIESKFAFNWQITCAHPDGQASFVFKVINNSCPFPTEKYVKLLIDIESENVNHPEFDTASSVFDVASNTTELVWFKPDTGQYFSNYVLWHSTGGQPVILDSIHSYLDTVYNHVNPPAGINRYWIRAMAGCVLKLDSINVNDTVGILFLKNSIGLEEDELELSIYPQPMINEVVFDGFQVDGNLQVKVMNSSGMIVHQSKERIVGKKASVNVSNLPPGVYVFVLFWDRYSAEIKLLKHE